MIVSAVTSRNPEIDSRAIHAQLNAARSADAASPAAEQRHVSVIRAALVLLIECGAGLTRKSSIVIRRVSLLSAIWIEDTACGCGG